MRDSERSRLPVKFLWPLVALAMALSGSAWGNLVVNGSFELPAMSGTGDIYSTDPSFTLPGWTYPTGGNRFFLEYGEPFGWARYHDGRQVVCLNGDGEQISLSQTIPTNATELYKIMFALGEESLARPSPTVVSVHFGSWSYTCALDSISGFAVFEFYCSAESDSTLLSFTDLTPGAELYRSPFIDAVSVTPCVTPVARSTWGSIKGLFR